MLGAAHSRVADTDEDEALLVHMPAKVRPHSLARLALVNE